MAGNKTRDAEQYEVHREKMAAKRTEGSKKARDIGKPPDVVSPIRRQHGGESFESFCREYFPEIFYLPWSADHRKAIEKIEKAVREGGLFGYAMPRGSGKTALAIAAYLWALLYGYQNFVAVIGSDADAASSLLESGKSQLENNDLLFEDFPEVCFPIRCMEGIAQRANGQLCEEEPTHIGWTADEIVFPTIKGSVSSAAVVRVRGITGRIRGMQFARPDGKIVRPGMVIPDDPQTDESAKSPTQVADREKIVKGAVLGLAGPGKKIAGIMPCTVIAKGDLADRILDRGKHPEWQGERTKLIYGWPKRDDLWEQYTKVRGDAMRAGRGSAESNEFYRANREAMDDGATAAWAVRHNPDEISAIQNGMNLFFDLGKEAFFAEYQNDPLDATDESKEALTVEQIIAKADGRQKGIVPRETTRLTAFIDVQQEVLFYAVLALEDDFTGHVVEYGTYPEQNREHFAKSNIRKTLILEEGSKRFEESLVKGLGSLCGLILSREWERDDSSTMKIDRCLIDAHWGASTDIVKAFCRKSTHAAVLLPSFGTYIGASQLPLTERTKKRGDRFGLQWIIPAPKPGMSRQVSFDSNFWKNFLQSRLGQSVGGAGCFTLFGAPEDHRLLADHLVAEYPIPTEGRGRRVVEWKIKPNRPDNDWLDCLVGCCVAGSISGANLAEHTKQREKPKIRLRLSQLQKEKSYG